MRKVVAFGAAILLAGSVGVAGAQERLPQHSGFGTGVGESAGTGSRSQIWDKSALLERLDQPETIQGRLFAVDFAQNRLFIETGGTGINEETAAGRAGAGARTVMTLYLTKRSNIQAIKALNVGDEVSIQAREETTEDQPYGTGRKLVLTVTLIRGEETMAGMGGLGQWVNPNTERGIVSNDASGHGGVVGAVLPGRVKGSIDTDVGVMTGSAPCWQCEPQPGWGYEAKGKMAGDAITKTDYRSYDNPDFVKGQ